MLDRLKCVLLISVVNIALSSFSSGQTSLKPDLTLTGTVTRADFTTYRELPFTVPSGVTRISVDLSYTERDKHTNIDLGIFDGERFRGWSGGNKSYFTISGTDATPSYLAGPIRAGTWTLILGIPRIREGVTSHYEAKIYFEHEAATSTVSTFSREAIRSGPAWYRGDLHMHDAHSDGSCPSQSGVKVPCPLYKTVEAAAVRHLDFIAISDHNTTSHFDAMRELQPYFDQLLLIPAREITTFQGHANVFGTTQFIDFRLTSPHVPNFNTILDRVQQLHAILSINHPGLPSGEQCMGCGWTVPNVDYSRVTAIEVINGATTKPPYYGIDFWQDKLNKGFRITGIAGSDNHNATIPDHDGSAIGTPTAVIYADNLSEAKLLDGIRSGHVFVDTQGTHEHAIEFTADTGQQHAIMGDNLQVSSAQKIHFTLTATALQNAHPELIMDGARSPLLNIAPLTEQHETRSFDLQSDGKRHWLRIDLRSADGQLLIVGNPIYLNF